MIFAIDAMVEKNNASVKSVSALFYKNKAIVKPIIAWIVKNDETMDVINTMI